MGRSFANATTDKMVAASVTPTTTQSFYWWQQGAPSGTAPRVLDWSIRPSLIWAAATTLQINRDWGTDGQWTRTVSALGTAWHHIAVTYDGSSTANDPIVYVDGVSPGAVTRVIAPAGSITNTAADLTVGNTSTGNRGLGTSMARLGVHNVVLTQGEIIEAMLYGFTPRGLLFYWPMFGLDSPEPDYSGSKANGTLTGSTGAVDPTIGPGLLIAPNFYHLTAAAPAPTKRLLALSGVGS